MMAEIPLNLISLMSTTDQDDTVNIPKSLILSSISSSRPSLVNDSQQLNSVIYGTIGGAISLIVIVLSFCFYCWIKFKLYSRLCPKRMSVNDYIKKKKIYNGLINGLFLIFKSRPKLLLFLILYF